MTRIRPALAVVALVGIAGPALAAPRSLVAKTETGAKITLYDSLCDEDNALECLIAEIGCDGPGDFTASLHDLNARDAASVFAKGNGKGSVTAGGASFVLQVGKVALSEHTFNWDVTATSLEQGRAVWAAISGAESVQLQAGAKKAMIRRGDVNEDSFREVVGLCGGAPR